MSRRYAEDTKVPVDQSLAEIKRLLTQHGATAFGHIEQGRQAAIMFEAHSRRIRFSLTMPDPNERELARTPTGLKRSEAQVAKAYEQAVRQRWRALLLVIKAKLESVESGITSFEDEFLAHTVLPRGDTVGEWLEPQLEQVYARGEMPPMLPGLGSGAIALPRGERP